ncbi:MAG: hypothetical protein ACMUIE_08920, partial [Thermoplasmatota archaeon]
MRRYRVLIIVVILILSSISTSSNALFCNIIIGVKNNHINPNIIISSQKNSTLLFSTFLGGSDYEETPKIAFDNEGNYIVVGYTSSSNFPVTSDAYDRSYNLNYDMTISIINESRS